MWHADMNGVYTVRSGYNFGMRLAVEGKNHVTGDWSSLWHTRVPPKTRNLAWRICRRCLPTRRRLHERRVQGPLNCAVCEDQLEDDWHLLFHCKTMAEYWDIAGLAHTLKNRTQILSSADQVMLDICSRETEDVVSRALFL